MGDQFSLTRLKSQGFYAADDADEQRSTRLSRISTVGGSTKLHVDAVEAAGQGGQDRGDDERDVLVEGDGDASEWAVQVLKR